MVGLVVMGAAAGTALFSIVQYLFVVVRLRGCIDRQMPRIAEV